MGLLFTFILGLFIVLGSLIVFIIKNNEKFVQFSISMAFGVILMLLFTDLIPELYQVIDSGNIIYNIVYILIGSTIGFLFLKILDYFIPDHDDEPGTRLDDDKNLKHIGLVSSIALVIHNIIEGMAICLLIQSDFKSGILACCGVGLHNIPLGMVIASTFYQSNQSRKKTLWIIIGISLSTFVGGILTSCFPLMNIMELIESVALTLTIGMLGYILLMELLPKIINSKYKKITILGTSLGILLLIFTLFV